MVAADHGESLGEHGERTHGVFVYDVDHAGAVDHLGFGVRGSGFRRSGGRVRSDCAACG